MTHGGEALSLLEILAGAGHALAQAGAVFLAGLFVFSLLVWGPAAGEVRERASGALGLAAWVLAGLLVLACAIELPVYAVRLSGEPLSLGLVGEALLATRVGHLWVARIALGLLGAVLISSALRGGGAFRWAGAGFLCAALLSTLTAQSHAAAEARLAPFVADLAHVAAASVWMGGLLGFPVVLLGALRGAGPEVRSKVLGRAVRRFTRAATVAVAVLVATGVYAALLHLPDLRALVETPYGRALVMKLGLVAFMFPIAAINMVDRGEGPFDRMVGVELLLAFGVFVATGFLTTLPPP